MRMRMIRIQGANEDDPHPRFRHLRPMPLGRALNRLPRPDQERRRTPRQFGPGVQPYLMASTKPS